MDKKEYAKAYYAKLKEKKIAERKDYFEPVDLSKVKRLEQLFVNDDLLRVYKTGTSLDAMFSHEGGIPVGTNVMCTGDPGVGKTTLLMHALSNLQRVNPTAKCVFVSAEMSKLQVFKYTKRFPEFANLETLFTSDFLGANIKQVLEQLLDTGYDYVLIDSIVEVLDGVREDGDMSQNQAEKWLMDLCVRHNEANNQTKRHTAFLLIQQVTKNGVFVGSNKLKHITDAHMEIKRESEREGGLTYVLFSKNRNGQSGIKYNFRLGSGEIHYDMPTADQVPQESKSFELQQELAF